MKTTAFAQPNGQIGFYLHWHSLLGVDINDCPKGTLDVATGDDEVVRKAITALAIHTPTGDFEVPGVAENCGKGKSLDALEEFRQRVKRFIERVTWGIDPLGA